MLLQRGDRWRGERMLTAEADRKFSCGANAVNNLADGAVISLLVCDRLDVSPVVGRDVAQVETELVEP